MAFSMTRVREVIWPEALGVATYIGAEVLAAAWDVTRKNGAQAYPAAQTAVTAAALGGGLLALGYGRAKDFATGLVFASGIGLMATTARSLYDRASNQPQVVRMEDMAALVPRKKLAGKSPPASGMGTTGLTLKNRGDGARVEVQEATPY